MNSVPFRFYVFFLVCLALAAPASACPWCGKAAPSTGRIVEYDLEIAQQTLSPAGKPVRALTINGTLPGPTLRFREGDTALIRVHNRLTREETSTHWHGLLVPNAQDGVPHVTTPPIPPGGTHTFEFPLTHGGTYWYHSHTHFQEQRGVYGSIVVTPRQGESVAADREEVIVFSDWTNENPAEVMRALQRGSDYYALKRGNAQSLLGAIQHGKGRDYFDREWSRMPPMDISDVGYDAFLLNGRRESALAGRPGERVRLRLINASAATYFYVTSATGPLTIVAADGPPVQPVKVDRLLMAIAETYDVIVTIPPSGRWELRATAHDGSGHTSAWLGEGEAHPVSDPPKPDVYSMDEMLNLTVEEQEDDPRASLRLPRPGSPYRLLRAPRDTTPPESAPVRELTMRLTGDMSRYVWSFDDKTMAESPYVHLTHGEVVRLELVNNTMMHHPIHLHGHFFRVLNGQGARSPLKHTVDVPPMGRRVIEFEANETGDWMFHCHILYHMMTGMARVFRNGSDTPAASQAHGHNDAPVTSMSASMLHAPTHDSLGEHGHDLWAAFGAASVQTHLSEGQITLMNAKDDLLLGWEVGWQDVEETQYEVDALYQRYVSADFQAFAGARLTNDEDAENRGVVGFNYRLPLVVWAGVSLDTEGNVRLTLAKRLQLTDRLAVFGRAEYDTNTAWEWTAGADFTLTKNLSLIAQQHSEFGFGAGVLMRF